MEQPLCRSNRPLRYKKKGERENLKSCYHDIPYYRMIQISQHDEKIFIATANLVETTLLTRYPRPMEVMYDQGSEIIGHEFIKPLIQKENGIIPKPRTSKK